MEREIKRDNMRRYRANMTAEQREKVLKLQKVYRETHKEEIRKYRETHKLKEEIQNYNRNQRPNKFTGGRGRLSKEECIERLLN